jgi:hypothetical protein
MSIIALFTVWNQPRSPSPDEWIKKMWNIDTTEYYSAIKEKEILTFAAKWLELEVIMLGKTDTDPHVRSHI